MRQTRLAKMDLVVDQSRKKNELLSIDDLVSTLTSDASLESKGRDLRYENFMVWWRGNEYFSSISLADPAVVKRQKISEIFRKFDPSNKGFVDRVGFRL
ncbi:MAG: hypothetical protein ACK5GJ_07720, partial [Planctomycetota bacterium]